MWNIILIRLEPEAKKIIAKWQASFREAKSTKEQI